MRLLRRLFSKKDGPKTDDDTCLYCGFDGEHVVFITAPPGYGSILRCYEGTSPYGISMTEDDARQRRRSEIAQNAR